MMDWHSHDDRNCDPNWKADWRHGHVLGALLIFACALVTSTICLLFDSVVESAERKIRAEEPLVPSVRLD